MYQFQRKCAHEFGLRVTNMITYDTMLKPNAVASAKEDEEKYASETGVWLYPTDGHANTMFWLLNTEEKREALEKTKERYVKTFGKMPIVVGSYVLDAKSIELIREIFPDVETVVAGCFEEGVKVYHGCNNSWYLFSEGMCWNPWYPSKTHSLRPARDEEDWSGLVALPHLSRDIALGYEQRNDFFASHTGNVQRGLANRGASHPYDFNLVDQYRLQEDFNDGFSYFQVHVSPGWLSGNFNVIDNDEITGQNYREELEYLATLIKEGKAECMTMSEFGKHYKKVFPIGKQTIGAAQDVLYGSGKQYFWMFDANYRVVVDPFQGGSIGDLRPYAGEYASFCGRDSDALDMNSYPYLIQSQYRTGYKHHYEDGSRTTFLVRHGGEELDMCTFPTKIKDIVRDDEKSILELNPVHMQFKDGAWIDIQTIYYFEKIGDIGISRKIIDCSDDMFEYDEYVKAGYGFTEYPEQMKGIELFIGAKKVIDYTYAGKSCMKKDQSCASAVVEAISTQIILEADEKADYAYVSEGHLFSPFYTLKLGYSGGKNVKEIKSWLRLRKTKA